MISINKYKVNHMYKNEKAILDHEVEFLSKQREYNNKYYLMNTTNDSDRKEKLKDELQILLANNLQLFLDLKLIELEKKFTDDTDFRKLVIEKFEEEKNKATS